MARRIGRRQRPGVEPLEGRVTPAPLMGAGLAGVHVEATHAFHESYSGSGTVTFTTPSGPSLIGSGSGTATGIGPFTGQVVVTFVPRSDRFEADASFQDPAGNGVSAVFSGAYKGNVATTRAKGTFKITGGSGQLTGATGSGKFGASPIVPVGTGSQSTLTFQGKIAYP